MTEPDWEALERAWAPARVSGALGPDSIEQLQANAAGFLPAALRVEGQLEEDWRALDVGTGVGVPGVLLALETPRWHWELIDASERRCQHAAAAVRALRLGDRVAVHHSRVDDLARDATWRGRGDLVVARLFGAPAELAECAVPLLRVGGAVHVSVSDTTEPIWRTAPLAQLGAEIAQEWRTDAGRYLRIEKVSATPAVFPRRPAARRRSPLF